MTVEALVKAGIAELEQRAAAQVAEDRARKAALEGQERIERRRFLEAASQALPDVLQAFVHVPSDRLSPLTRTFWIRIAVPGCAVMIAHFDRAAYEGELERPWAWDGHYHVKGSPFVRRPYELGEEPEIEFYQDGPRQFEAGELHLALGWSARIAEKTRQLAEGLDEERRERAARVAQWEREKAEREKRAAERVATTEAEQDEARARLLEVLEPDPVAMALLRVFVAVREDRWSLETALREGELER